METLTYRVVFDAAASGFRYWWLLAFGLGGFLAGLALLHLANHPPFRDPRGRTLGWIFVIGAPAFAAITFGMAYQDYADLRGALQTGHFTSVKGQVTNFAPSDLLGKEPETFQVAGHVYSYQSSVLAAGYNGSSGPNPIHEGMRVRIADVEGQIARLEVATNGPAR